MPPRLPRFPCLWSLQARSAAPTPIVLPFRPVHITAAEHRERRRAEKRRKQDPYVRAQAAAKQAANLSRQEVLRKQRALAFGDPVKGTLTPFVESFDTGGVPHHGSDSNKAPSRSASAGGELMSDDAKAAKIHLKNFLTREEIDERLKESHRLSAPLAKSTATGRGDMLYGRAASEAQAATESGLRHDNAATAISRIVSLQNASSRDRRHINIQRCVETFGRHNTEKTLPPRPISLPSISIRHPDPKAWAAEKIKEMEEKREQNKRLRAGPDTGSSEVQIAILTARIRALSTYLETRGKGDKINKRNLRLMVHRRQKLLKYLWRKEKGGPRWQHCVDTLGITDGMWKGEITM